MCCDILFKTITMDEKKGLPSNKLPFVLEYHLLKRESMYGVGIVKRYAIAGVTAYEEKREYLDLCSDFEEAASLLERITGGMVTPLSLNDVLSDIVGTI